MANLTNNTIFDDVFRTMVEKMPNLAVPLINEIFGTAYPEDIKIIQKRNEHQTKYTIWSARAPRTVRWWYA